MTVTLLLDLDNTLLTNSMDSFAPAYFQRLARCMAPYAEASRLIEVMMAATNEMMRNRRPDRTLEETFDSHFYPALAIEKEPIRATIEAFYADEFPKLRSVTAPRPEAVALVQEALRRNYRVAIATNPLFPRTAIVQRLTWAGLHPSEYPFALIPSYETFHFSKPDAAFPIELLAHMGWPEGAVVMVGDEYQNDVVAARAAGIPAYWVTSPNTPSPNGAPPPSGRGSLADFFPWLDSHPLADLTPDFSSPTALVAILRSTPAALQTISASRSEAAWHIRPTPKEWCLAEIACHLRDTEREVNIDRIRQVLRTENPFLAARDTDVWADERGYRLQDGPQALRDFTQARIELLALLDHLGPEDWQRPARHAIFGPTRLLELISIIAGHDRLHVRQFVQQLN